MIFFSSIETVRVIPIDACAFHVAPLKVRNPTPDLVRSNLFL